MALCAWVASLFLGLTCPGVQDQTSDTRFDRVHLRNGNFVDGRIVKSSPTEITLKLQVGEMTVRRDQIERIEKVAMKSITESQKPPPPTPPTPVPAKLREKEDPRPPPPAGSEIQKKVVEIFTELHRADFESKPRVLEKFGALGEEGALFLAEQLPILDAASAPYAAAALGRLREPKTLPILAAQLRHPKGSVRGLAASALGPFGDSAPAAEITGLLSDPDPAVRGAAVGAVHQIAPREALAPLSRLTADPSPEVRARAVEAIFDVARRNEMQRDLAVALASVIERAPATTRPDVLRAIGRTGSKDLWNSAAPHLRDPSPRVRAAAAACLGELGAADASESILLAAQAEQEKEPRLALASAAEKLRVIAAAGPMIAWLRAEDAALKKAVQDALKALTGQDLGADADAWQKYWDSARPK